jgi:hypothetical protein
MRLPFALVLMMFAMVTAASAASTPLPRLQFKWPPGWEYQPEVREGSTVQLQARRRVSGQPAQRLHLIVIDTRLAQAPITSTSIKELAERLRDAAAARAHEGELSLRPFSGDRGHYFVLARAKQGAHESNELEDSVEGVLFESGYLINFSLQAIAANDPAVAEMIEALDGLRVVHDTASS